MLNLSQNEMCSGDHQNDQMDIKYEDYSPHHPFPKDAILL